MSEAGKTRGELKIIGLAPHPPIMVPEVGKGQERVISASLEAMMRLGEELAAADPEVVVVITPHGPLFQDAVSIAGVAELKGNLGQFGAPRVDFSFENDQELIDQLAVAVEDEASLHLTEEAVLALRSIGAEEDLRGMFRWAHAIIGVKGARPGQALEATGLLRPVSVRVGQGFTEPTAAAAIVEVEFAPVQ